MPTSWAQATIQTQSSDCIFVLLTLCLPFIAQFSRDPVVLTAMWVSASIKQKPKVQYFKYWGERDITQVLRNANKFANYSCSPCLVWLLFWDFIWVYCINLIPVGNKAVSHIMWIHKNVKLLLILFLQSWFYCVLEIIWIFSVSNSYQRVLFH